VYVVAVCGEIDQSKFVQDSGEAIVPPVEDNVRFPARSDARVDGEIGLPPVSLINSQPVSRIVSRPTKLVIRRRWFDMSSASEFSVVTPCPPGAEQREWCRAI
jgi:hypothetical protein